MKKLEKEYLVLKTKEQEEMVELRVSYTVLKIVSYFIKPKSSFHLIQETRFFSSNLNYIICFSEIKNGESSIKTAL